MFAFLIVLVTISSALGKKDTSCDFNARHGMCDWKLNKKHSCAWELKKDDKYNGNEGYVVLNGANRCFSTIVWKFGMFDSSATNFLTIEYYVVGPGPFSLEVSNDIFDHPDWFCSMHPGSERRTAHVNVTGEATYVHIKSKVAKGSRIIITQIWNSLQEHEAQRKCVSVPRVTAGPTTTPTITSTPTPTTKTAEATTASTATPPSTPTKEPTKTPTNRPTPISTTRPTMGHITRSTNRPTTGRITITTKRINTEPTKTPTGRSTPRHITRPATGVTTRPTSKSLKSPTSIDIKVNKTYIQTYIKTNISTSNSTYNKTQSKTYNRTYRKIYLKTYINLHEDLQKDQQKDIRQRKQQQQRPQPPYKL